MRDFEKEYKDCKELEGDTEINKCLYSLLHDLTKVQDNIQLAVKNTDYSRIFSKCLTDNSNGIILGVSRNNGNVKDILNEGYVEEKVGYLLTCFNNLTHDYNITLEDGFKEQFSKERIIEREKPAPEEVRIFQKKSLFGD